MFFRLIDKYPGGEFLGFRVDTYLTSKESVSFLKCHTILHSHPEMYESSSCSTSSLAFGVVSLTLAILVLVPP